MPKPHLLWLHTVGQPHKHLNMAQVLAPLEPRGGQAEGSRHLDLLPGPVAAAERSSCSVELLLLRGCCGCGCCIIRWCCGREEHRWQVLARNKASPFTAQSTNTLPGSQTTMSRKLQPATHWRREPNVHKWFQGQFSKKNHNAS
jgi:hypothetical protein